MIVRFVLRYKLLLFGLFLPIILSSCAASPNVSHHNERNQKKIKKGKEQLKDCDLILRTGRSFISSALRRFSLQDQTYSHCGIVRIIKGKIWVYHVIGGEANPSATIRRESFQSFCNPKQNIGFGIFRFHLNQVEKKSIDSLTNIYYKDKIPFDLDFNLETNNAFYCSEFIYKTVNKSTHVDYIPTSHLGDFKYVAIDNLYLNKHTFSIYQAVFR